eukprot:1023242-Amphidinium_carterae.1
MSCAQSKSCNKNAADNDKRATSTEHVVIGFWIFDKHHSGHQPRATRGQDLTTSRDHLKLYSMAPNGEIAILSNECHPSTSLCIRLPTMCRLGPLGLI